MAHILTIWTFRSLSWREPSVKLRTAQRLVIVSVSSVWLDNPTEYPWNELQILQNDAAKERESRDLHFKILRIAGWY